MPPQLPSIHEESRSLPNQLAVAQYGRPRGAMGNSAEATKALGAEDRGAALAALSAPPRAGARRAQQLTNTGQHERPENCEDLRHQRPASAHTEDPRDGTYSYPGRQ